MTMAADIVAGSVETGDLLSNRIPIDMSPDITRKTEMNAPFTVLLELMNAFETSKGRKFEWMERDDYQNTVTLSSAYTADAGVMTMADDYVLLHLGDILYHPGTSVYFRVTTSGTMDATVDVEDNFPSTSGASNIAAGEELYIIGNAQDEFSNVSQLIASKPTAKYNYIQHFRQPFGVSGRVNASELIGGSEYEYLRDDHYRAFMRRREAAFLFGVRGLQASTDITSSGGLKYFMDAAGSNCHQRDMSGLVLTQAEWDDFLKDAMYEASGPEKLLITGRNVPAYLNGFAKKYLKLDMEIKKWGLHIKEYETPDGLLRILHHKLFTELGLDDEAWVLDLPSLKRRGLAGERSTPHLNTGVNGAGIQLPGEDGVKVEYSVEEGLEFRHAERFARIYNVAAA
jgi:hypothetical protein